MTRFATNFRVIGFFGVFVSSLAMAQPSNLAAPVDLAVDTQTGKNFILARDANPRGEVVVTNSKGQVLQTFTLFEQDQASAHYEIELLNSRRLVFLVQRETGWELGEMSFREGRWQKSLGITLFGDGQADTLLALPIQKPGDVLLTLNVESSSDSGKAMTYVIRRQVVGGSFEIEKQIEKSDFLAASELMSKHPWAQSFVAADPTDSDRGLGFAAGLPTGVGFAYRQQFKSQWGLQVAGIAFGASGNVNANLGLSIMRALNTSQRTRLYAMLALSAFYSESSYTDHARCPPEIDPKAPISPEPCTENPGGGVFHRDNETILNFGVGIGMEFRIGKNIGLAIELPLTARYRAAGTRASRGLDGIYPVPSIALIYYFNNRFKTSKPK